MPILNRRTASGRAPPASGGPGGCSHCRSQRSCVPAAGLGLPRRPSRLSSLNQSRTSKASVDAFLVFCLGRRFSLHPRRSRERKGVLSASSSRTEATRTSSPASSAWSRGRGARGPPRDPECHTPRSALPPFRGNHLSNTTCLTHVFFPSCE